MDDIPEKLASISKGQKIEFADSFIKEYTRDSFGSISAKELKILLFSHFKRMGLISDSDSRYNICRTLKITPAQAQSLSLESQLRDPGVNEEYIRKSLINSLKTCELIKDNKFISFGIEDPLVKMHLSDLLQKKGSIPDFSFNKNIMKVSISAFSEIIDMLIPKDKEKKNILERANKDETLKDYAKKTVAETLIKILTNGTPQVLNSFLGLCRMC